ncbi:MAG: phosphonopyruvate decarboxylase [Bosea sp. (in: a-proteobacteria)]
MVDAKQFTLALQQAGFDFITGVPCSLLTAFINQAISDPVIDHVGATSEGEACAIAAGAWIGGRTPVVYLQNSGLGNTINPLTSLNHSFRVPSLLLVTWRGEPGEPDEPQHDVMGRSTHALLDAIGIPHAPFPASLDALRQGLVDAQRAMDTNGLPFAFIIRKGDITGDCPAPAPTPLVRPEAKVRQLGTTTSAPRYAVLEAVASAAPPEAVLIATTGKTGRELFTVGDKPRNLYVVGSMGCASAMALGLALTTPRPVIILDGDGAALMKLGNLATIGHQRPANLVHVLLDNGVHDSTGGQQTVSQGVDFALVAAACGYATSTSATEPEAIAACVADACQTPGPHFLRATIKPGSITNLGRPDITPPEVARRLKAFVAGGAAAASSLAAE